MPSVKYKHGCGGTSSCATGLQTHLFAQKGSALDRKFIAMRT